MIRRSQQGLPDEDTTGLMNDDEGYDQEEGDLGEAKRRGRKRFESEGEGADDDEIRGDESRKPLIKRKRRRDRSE